MSAFRNIIQAILVRCLLLLHSLLSIWRAVTVTGNIYFWYLLCSNMLLVAECLYSVMKRKGQERKWFCPCFLFYLFSTVPSIWLLELDRVNRYGESLTNQSTSSEQSDINIQGISIVVSLDADAWVSALEQSLLFLLIIGRWLLPRGKLTRDQLSQLLFMYLGSASDVMELFILFEEPEVRKDLELSYTILTVWSASLFLFTLVVSATKKPRPAISDPVMGNNKTRDKSCNKLFQSEIWSLLVTILFLDGPYMVIRLYTLIRYRIFRYGIIFFTCKNALIISLLLYRLLVVCLGKNESTENVKAIKLTKKVIPFERNDVISVGNSSEITKEDLSISDIGFKQNDDVQIINIDEPVL
ncbi:hypothetical protein KUTeg_002982 [Tegillarca granosa]|uniref:Transmembrane protein 26 n=1 Tax=Tegillarca granosa TaxID=220873 RepID=A0ABQ9FP06_TEGGR|nr:hypothetical protein KUTeg_017411 [Tegillarca granosa]KAJ8317891.1 hypothetical protein KUTeg_002982 [Tegillarca granosa]